MSRPHQSEPAAPAAPGQTPTSTRYWLFPALTFIIGLALGAVVIAVGEPDISDSAGAAVAPPTAVASATPSAAGGPSDRTVTVPASCEQGLDRARTALSTVGDAVDALRALDTARLQQLLDQLQRARQEVDRLADQCRREAPARN